jgi:hypothetical protein
LINKILKSQDKIFLGVVSSNKGLSNAIRNSQIISNLKAENNIILIIDFGIVYNFDQKIFKFILFILLIIKTILVFLLKPKSQLFISTNPKWLLLFPLIFSRSFILYLGDPFIGDVSRQDTRFYKFLWSKSKNLIKELFVFSPFLLEKLKKEKEIDLRKIKFWKRLPIQNLPKMKGSGIMYLGDFNSVDRNFLPLLSILNKRDIKLDLYGRGENKLINNSYKNISVNKRRPLEQVIKLIPNYKILLIILNRTGFQVPGKIYDFAKAPFPVLILYEKNLDIKLLPRVNNYIYCKNKIPEITKVFNELL